MLKLAEQFYFIQIETTFFIVLISFVILFVFILLIPESIKYRLVIRCKTIALIASYVIIVNYLCILCFYALHNNFFDHVEPNIAAVSWLFQKGAPIYHPGDSAERYSIGYGPTLYIVNGFFLNLFKPSIFAAKFSGVLAAGLTLVFIFLTIKKFISSQIATFCLAYVALYLLVSPFGFMAASFWTRSDPLILMCVSLSLLSVVRTNSRIAIPLTAILLGLSVNLKIHSLLYFLPVYALLYYQSGIYAALASALGSILIAIVPFVLLPQASLENYILWLRELGKHSIELDILKSNLIWSIYLFLLPITILFAYFLYINKREFKQFLLQQKEFIFALTVSLSAVAIIASIHGAGMNHLIGFFPIFVYWFSLALSEIIAVHKEDKAKEVNKNFYYTLFSLIIALIVANSLRLFINESRFISLGQKYNYGFNPINEIEQILTSHVGMTVGMGYAATYDLSFYRPILSFQGNSYLIDAVLMMDMELRKMPMPQKTLTALSSCQTKIWLIPKGDSPFQLRSYQSPNETFDENFRSTFLANYEIRESEQTKYYDLWFCKKS